MDDMITKFRDPAKHTLHLEEAFELLRQYRIKLNPEKCVFEVSSGKFLGFMISHKGIKANPKKIQAIIKMKSPRTLKDIQSLTGKLATLNRFIS